MRLAQCQEVRTVNECVELGPLEDVVIDLGPEEMQEEDFLV